MKRVVVTGATGFIGRYLVWELLDAGYEVTALVRNHEKARQVMGEKMDLPLLHIMDCDLARLSSMRPEQFGQHDYFFHIAWSGVSGHMLSDYTIQTNNVKYAVDAIRFAKAIGCKRFIGAGSLHELECMQEMENSSGTVPLGNYYKISKLSAHYLCRLEAIQLGIDFLWPRLTNTYGAGEISERLLNRVIRQLLRGQSPDLTDGTQLYNFIYITDAVRGYRLIAEKGVSFEHYILGSEEVRPLRDYLTKVQQIVAPHIEMGFGRYPVKGIHLGYDSLYSDTLHRDTGFYTQVPFEEGIRLTMDQIKKELS